MRLANWNKLGEPVEGRDFEWMPVPRCLNCDLTGCEGECLVLSPVCTLCGGTDTEDLGTLDAWCLDCGTYFVPAEPQLVDLGGEA